METVTSKCRSIVKDNEIKSVEKKFGCDFGGHILQSELGYKSREGYDYTPSPNHIKKYCSRLSITEKDSIMDLGCGKGYAMYLMSRYPFSKIRGIEKSTMLAQIAGENMRKIDVARFDVYSIDATKMLEDMAVKKDVDSTNYFYIYNSFP